MYVSSSFKTFETISTKSIKYILHIDESIFVDKNKKSYRMKKKAILVNNLEIKMDKKKLRYAILKTLDDKKNPFTVLPNAEVTEEDILEQGRFLSREDYITKNFYADNTIYMWGQLTEKGEEYLDENSTFAKAYSVAKEIREWLPFFTSK